MRPLSGFMLAGQFCPYGPLMADQLGDRKAVDDFFRNHPLPSPAQVEILSAIELPLQKSSEVDLHLRQLYLCFSALGSAAVLMGRWQSQRAWEALDWERCPDCVPPEGYSVELPPLCTSTCEHFVAHNPAYAALPHGTELHFQHAVELRASIQLAFAHEAAHRHPVNSQIVSEYLSQTVALAEIFHLGDVLRARLGEYLRGWAAERKNDPEQWDDAVALLEITEGFTTGEDWKGDLAALLNVRGVAAANDHTDWPRAAADLRRACRLNPYVPVIRDNLLKVLQNWWSAATDAREYARASQLLEEIQHLEQPSPEGETPSQPLPAEKAAEAGPTVRSRLPPNEIYHESLFDEFGDLKITALRDSGVGVLELARQAAASLHKQNIQLPALVMALTQYRRSVLKRLLEAQNIVPERVFAIAEEMATALGSDGDNGLAERTVLNQDDFQNATRYVLGLAWDIAQYDTPPTIGDVHLFAALLMRAAVVGLLQKAGADSDLMNSQILWG